MKTNLARICFENQATTVPIMKMFINKSSSLEISGETKTNEKLKESDIAELLYSFKELSSFTKTIFPNCYKCNACIYTNQCNSLKLQGLHRNLKKSYSEFIIKGD